MMARPTPITLNNHTYYNASDLKLFVPTYFFGTSRTIRQIIAKRNIPPTAYTYATLSKMSGWRASSDQNKPSTNASLLLCADWVKSNVPGMNQNDAQPEATSQQASSDYPEAPPLLTLEENEKFRDNDGNIFEIETRGNRTTKGIYFLAKDVATAFDMPNLVKNIKDKSSGVYYVEHDHYAVFHTTACRSKPEELNETKAKMTIYITYKGMLKILFTSRSGRADRFLDWATDVLFTAQMGTPEKREALASNIIGQPVESVRAVFRTFAKKVPCIYRFALGTAKTLRSSMSIPNTINDNFVIVKYGLTDDINRRTGEHVRTYEKINGVRLGLMNFVYVDPKYLYQAESDIRDFFQTIETPIAFNSFSELVAIDPAHEKQIKKQFEYIGATYAGTLTDLIIQIEKLKNDIEMLKKNHEIELLKRDAIIGQKNMENKLLVAENKYKDLELSIYKK